MTLKSSKIFISYKRDDTLTETRQIRDKLITQGHIPDANIFWDYMSVPIGSKFDEIIERAIKNSQIMLVIIGKEWFIGEQQISENVHKEIKLALDTGLIMIPIFVQELKMKDMKPLPDDIQALFTFNACSVHPVTLDADIGNILASMDIQLNQKSENVKNQTQNYKLSKWLPLGLSLFMMIAFAVSLLTIILNPHNTTLPPPTGKVPLSSIYYETTGVRTHTWTNYRNSGGNKGSDIMAHQTVQVACRVSGYKFADGNTWWYRITENPWKNAYYASADAFYNDGQVTGPMINSPLVDAKVPTCDQSTPQPSPSRTAVSYHATATPRATSTPSISTPLPTPTPQPPPTYYETTYGVTHTWTNYTNAGGTEGQSIASYQTVQVTCRVQGFKVADGDTWWYRITPSPWNGNFYGSADAFYNNGQTSGNPAGTPFVDTNVPLC